jgi:hypothetical protein
MRALAWVAYERNTSQTWRRAEEATGEFLNRLWEDGVLLGEHAEQAYFARCDSTTMTDSDIRNGRLILSIGVAPSPLPVPVELPVLEARPW